MKSEEEVERLEKVIGQLKGVHSEIAILAKKSPNDAVNKFKLKLINQILLGTIDVLGEQNCPLEGFKTFDEEDMPTNSDVTFVIAQFLEEGERYRAANVVLYAGQWYYRINGERSEIASGIPNKLKAR